MLTDSELAKQYKKRDPKAIDQIIERYHKPLLNFVYKVIGDSHEAEDIVQEVWLRFIERYNPDRPGKLSAFLFIIAYRLTLNKVKSAYTRRVRLIEEQKIDSHTSRDDKNNFTKYIENKFMVQHYLDKLPDDLKNILILRYMEELTLEEISEIMDIAIATVSSRITKAFFRIHSIIKSEGGGQK